MSKAGALRGVATGVLAAGLASLWMAAWAQVDTVIDERHAESLEDVRRDAAPIKVPAFPKEADLVGFFVSSANDFNFFIDGKSISIGSDGEVRYTLVARSPEGVDNVSYEGVRCRDDVYRIYATGHADRSWSRRTTPWRQIEFKSVARWRNALLRDYFCPGGAPILTVAEGIDGLERGRNTRMDESNRF